GVGPAVPVVERWVVEMFEQHAQQSTALRTAELVDLDGVTRIHEQQLPSGDGMHAHDGVTVAPEVLPRSLALLFAQRAPHLPPELVAGVVTCSEPVEEVAQAR